MGFWFLLGAHEWGHRQAAKEASVQLYWPLIVPAGFGFLGSFGGITRFRGFVPDREVLLKVGVAGVKGAPSCCHGAGKGGVCTTDSGHTALRLI